MKTNIQTITPQVIADWLNSLTGISAVRTCTVTIGKESWPAAFYRQEYHYTEGMSCVRDGTHSAGESYFQTAFYCVGKLPQSYTKSVNVCFPHDGIDWYIAGYIKEIGTQYEWAHPFGINFMLRPWDLPVAIDKYDKTYRRVPLTVEYTEAVHGG